MPSKTLIPNFKTVAINRNSERAVRNLQRKLDYKLREKKQNVQLKDSCRNKEKKTFAARNAKNIIIIEETKNCIYLGILVNNRYKEQIEMKRMYKHFDQHYYVVVNMETKERKKNDYERRTNYQLFSEPNMDYKILMVSLR